MSFSLNKIRDNVLSRWERAEVSWATRKWYIGGTTNEICYKDFVLHRAFSHDVMSVMLVSQNNKTAVMLVSQTSSVVTKSHA